MKLWRRPSAFDAIPPTPDLHPVDFPAEGRRLALAGLHPREVSGSFRLQGSVASARGDLAEERVLRLLLAPGRPAWLLSARRTRKGSAEDAAGVDLYVQTADAGDLAVQVKSSGKGARAFLRRREGVLRGRLLPAARLPADLAVVVARAEAPDAEVSARALSALLALRLRVLGR